MFGVADDLYNIRRANGKAAKKAQTELYGRSFGRHNLHILPKKNMSLHSQWLCMGLQHFVRCI